MAARLRIEVSRVVKLSLLVAKIIMGSDLSLEEWLEGTLTELQRDVDGRGSNTLRSSNTLTLNCRHYTCSSHSCACVTWQQSSVKLYITTEVAQRDISLS